MNAPSLIAPDLYPTQIPAPEEEVPNCGRAQLNFIDALTHIAERRWLVAKIIGVAVLSGIALCFLLPSRYTATAKILPPQQTQPAASLLNQLAGSGSGVLTAVAAKQLGVKNPNDTYIGLLNSRPVADAVIRKFDLTRVYRARDMTAAREKLADRTVIASEKNGFISLSVTDHDRQRAPAMANAFADQLRILLKTLAVGEASQRRLFYEDQLKTAKDALVTAEVSLEQVQQNKGLVQLDAQAKAMIEGLAALRAQIDAKQVELQAIRSYSTDNNPEVQLAERELASLQQEAARMGQRNTSPGSAGMGLLDVPGAGLAYLRAEHEVKYRQAMFDLLLKQYDAARLDEAQEAAVIQVVEPAIEPERRAFPHRGQILLLFALGGLALGCLCALFPWACDLLLADPIRKRQIQQLQCALAQKSRTGF